MKKTLALLGMAAALAAAASGSLAAEPAPLKIVASFSILGDLVSRVGGDRVAVSTLVGPNGDAHVFEPTPDDARRVAAADLVVINGLGLEGWLDRLVAASESKAEVVVASTGVAPRSLAEEAAKGMPTEAEEEHAEAGAGAPSGHDIDPHAWQDVRNAEAYVANIADGLCKADRDGCPAYEANAATFRAELAALDGWVRGEIAAIPDSQRRVITTHDAFGYFAKAYGVTFLAPESVSTETEASAADVAAIIRQARAAHITALFLENVTDPRLVEQIGRETGARVGGELYSDALSPPDGPAPTYVAMMRHNVQLITAAMKGS